MPVVHVLYNVELYGLASVTTYNNKENIYNPEINGMTSLLHIFLVNKFYKYDVNKFMTRSISSDPTYPHPQILWPRGMGGALVTEHVAGSISDAVADISHAQSLGHDPIYILDLT